MNLRAPGFLLGVALASLAFDPMTALLAAWIGIAVCVLAALLPDVRPEARAPDLDLDEFRSAGYLHEVNRRVLHPLGLALEMQPSDQRPWWRRLPRLPRSRAARLTRVWDCRDDPEGITFGGDRWDETAPGLVANVDRLWVEREPARCARLGWMIQPVPDDESS